MTERCLQQKIAEEQAVKNTIHNMDPIDGQRGLYKKESGTSTVQCHYRGQCKLKVTASLEGDPVTFKTDLGYITRFSASQTDMEIQIVGRCYRKG